MSLGVSLWLLIKLTRSLATFATAEGLFGSTPSYVVEGQPF